MENILEQYKSVSNADVKTWVKVGVISDFPENSGACIKYKTKQIAVFNFTRTSKWYASQNICPHKMEMVLSIGMIGNKEDVPKVSCPLHKKNFSLEDGSNLAGEDYKIAVYPVKIENENVYIGFND